MGLANKGQIKLQEGFYSPRMMDLELQTDGEMDCQRLSRCRKKKSVMHVPQQFRKPSHCFHPSTVLVLLFPRNVFILKVPMACLCHCGNGDPPAFLPLLPTTVSRKPGTSFPTPFPGEWPHGRTEGAVCWGVVGRCFLL